MNYKLDWHPASIAKEWPKGSVVLMRVKLKPEWDYSYFLQTDFENQDLGSECQYLLVEEKKENNDKGK